MTPDQWQQIESVLQQTLDLPTDERRVFLADVCARDEQIGREVSSLVAAHDESHDFIEEPAIVSDAELIFSLGENNVGRDIGNYRILERLGAGGMGEVYLATDQRLDRTVALKVLPGYLSDEHRLLRFHKEARAASGLNHPNIITIHEVGEAEDIRFIATEFIEGETLRHLINRKALSVPQALNIAEQVCGALVAAHSAGIIHRDIKPENIMRRPDGIVKLLDFGIAKLTEAANTSGPFQTAQTELGMVIGTASYMSPEQARGLSVDERSDIWSLGVVLYEMLTGRLPFSGATRLDLMVAIVERDPEPLAPGSRIQGILDKCLAKDPLARYSSASVLHADIEAVLL